MLCGGVAIERLITVGRVVVADCVVLERISASGTIIKPAGVARERINAGGGVEAAIGIAKQGSKTGRRILVAGSEVVKRLVTGAGVPDSTGAADQYPNTFAIVGAGYGALRVGTHRLRRWGKRKGAKCKENDCCEYDVSIFHKLNTDGEGHVFQKIDKIFRDLGFWHRMMDSRLLIAH